MTDDLALRVLAALAWALASVRRRARKVLRAFAVALALVTTSGQGRTSVTRQTRADWHFVDHFALSIHPTWARLTGSFYSSE